MLRSGFATGSCGLKHLQLIHRASPNATELQGLFESVTELGAGRGCPDCSRHASMHPSCKALADLTLKQSAIGI